MGTSGIFSNCQAVLPKPGSSLAQGSNAVGQHSSVLAKLLGAWGALIAAAGSETGHLQPTFRAWPDQIQLCRWSPGSREGCRARGHAGVRPHPATEDTEGCPGQISQLPVPRATLAQDTCLDSVREWKAVFPECFCISVFMSLHEPSAHGALLSNQVHQPVVETREEERPSDSDSAQTKLSLVSKGRGEHPRLLRSDLSSAICWAVQMGELLWQDKQCQGSTSVC